MYTVSQSSQVSQDSQFDNWTPITFDDRMSLIPSHDHTPSGDDPQLVYSLCWHRTEPVCCPCWRATCP